MSPEKAERIFQEFPDIFHKDKLIYGFDCQDGWFDLLWRLSCQLREYKDQFTDFECFEIMQVFQDVGGLRIQIAGGNEGIQNLIQETEEKSWSICELDGEPATGVFFCAPSWFRCLCKTCSELHGYMKIENFLYEKSVAIATPDHV